MVLKSGEHEKEKREARDIHIILHQRASHIRILTLKTLFLLTPNTEITHIADFQ